VSNRDKKDDDELGSLAQSARKSSLGQARAILIVVGVLTLLLNIFLYSNVDNEVAKVRRENPGMVIDQDAVKLVRLIYAGTAGLGAVFIVLGLAVYKAPVACTVTGLVLYVAGIAVFAVIDPQNLVRGLIIKVIIIVALVKAVQAAAAYQKEHQAELAAARDRDDDY
jgi:hypothetical protein